MSSYTMPLRTLVEQATQYQSGLSTAERIEQGRKNVFDFDYPIFDEAYRKVFETNFIRRFYMREIGFETEGLFKFQLETWLLINMPYFNKMFESELIDFNPLENSAVDVTHTKSSDKVQNDVNDGTRNTTNNEISNVVENQTSSTTGKTDSTGSSDTTSTETTSDDSTGTKTDDNFERKLNSNNPDTRLGITAVDGQGVIEYASSIEEENENNLESTESHSDGTRNVTAGTDTVDSSTSNSSLIADSTGDSTVDRTGQVIAKDTLVSNINDVEDFIQHRAGKIGIQTYSKMLMEYRQTFLRIENKIHEEMQDLFMLVY